MAVPLLLPGATCMLCAMPGTVSTAVQPCLHQDAAAGQHTASKGTGQMSNGLRRSGRVIGIGQNTHTHISWGKTFKIDLC